MDLIKTRPDDPVPTMVATLSKIIDEADEKAKAEAIKLNNQPLSEEELEEYYYLMAEKEKILEEVLTLGNLST